jgi:ligand-binding sensor domain-containing protein
MRFIFTISIVFFHLCLFGQGQYRFQHFTIKDGLSQNTVNCVLRDKQGLYWIGTQDGLNLYDGYSVKIFRHDLKDTNTISDNFILSLAQDQYGNIWVGTRNGFNLFDR